jgi:phosphodiesterase/alkaline phosphatase D-like protein
MPAFWTDNFDRANGSLGAPWINLTGTFVVASNVAKSGQAGECVAAWDASIDNRLQGPDSYVQANLVKATTTNFGVGLVLKYHVDSVRRYYMGQLRTNGAGEDWRIYRLDNTTFTLLADVNASGFTASTPVRLTYESGAGLLTLAAFETGSWVTKATATDTNFRNIVGAVGLRSTNTEGTYNNFEAGVPDGVIALSTTPLIGGVTASTANISFRTSDEADVTVEYSTASDLSGSTTTSPVSTSSADDYTGSVTLTGLSADTTYYYRVKVDGTAKIYTPFPNFKTFPASGSAASFAFAWGSCQSTGTNAVANDVIWDAVVSKSPRFLCHLGDFYYIDVPILLSNTIADYRNRVRVMLSSGSRTHRMNAALRSLPMAYMWDDHDIEDGWEDGKTGRWITANQAAGEYLYRAGYAPIQSGERYHAFNYGNCGVFVLDGRTYRDPVADPDDASKTCLGTQQKTDLKAWLLAHRNNYKFKFICSGTCMHPWGTTPDAWGEVYTTEIQEIWDYIIDNGIRGCVFLSADQHWGCIVGQEYGGATFYEAQASAFNEGARTTTTSTDGQILYKTDSTPPANFGLVTVDQSVSPATVKLAIHNASGTEIGAVTIDEDDINAGIPFITSVPVFAHHYRTQGIQ